MKPESLKQEKVLTNETKLKETEIDTLEDRIGEEIITIGKAIKEHPSLEQLKNYAKRLGKDVLELLGIVKRESKKGERRSVGSLENHKSLEGFENALKTIAAYGMYALILSGNNFLTRSENKLQQKQETEQTWASNEEKKEGESKKQEEQSLIIDGPKTSETESHLYIPNPEEIYQTYETEDWIFFFDGSEEDREDFKQRIFEDEPLLQKMIKEEGYFTKKVIEQKMKRSAEKAFDHYYYFVEEGENLHEINESLIKHEKEDLQKLMEAGEEKNKEEIEYTKRRILYFETFREIFEKEQGIFEKEFLKNVFLSKLKEKGLFDQEYNSSLKDAPEDISQELKEKIIEKKYNELVEEVKKREENLNQYKYYHQDLFNSFENFYQFAKEDETFRENILRGEKIENEKMMKHIFKEKYKEIKENIKKFEEEKQEILKVRKSDAYLKRLIKELDGGVEAAKKLQEKRVEKIKNLKFHLSNFSYSTKDDALGHHGYLPESDYIAFANEGHEYNPYLGTHEYSHASDYGGENIPEGTKKVFKKDYTFKKRQTEFEKKYDSIHKEKYGKEYYSNPTEILARKAVFDTELEKLGIKKYEEEFTQEHYKKIKKLKKEGKLSRNSDQFFRMFERDALIMIMNTIAYQDWKEKGVPIDTGKVAEEMIAQILENQKQKPTIKRSQMEKDTAYPEQFFNVEEDVV